MLFTCGGKWAGLVLQLREAMRRVPALSGGKLLVADCAALTPGGCFADGVVKVPPAGDPSFVGCLLNACASRNVRVVVPHTSLDMGYLAPEVGRFAEHGISLVCTSPELLELCYDKERFAGFADTEGLAQPRSCAAEEFEVARYPLFAKRRRGYGSLGSGIVRSPADARAALAHDPELIFQEFVDAPEATVDAYIAADGRCPFRVPRIRDKIADGEAMRSHTFRQAAFNELVDRTIAALARRGLRGPLNVQAFVGERPLLIEVNPRLGSGSVLGNAATGGRYFEALLREACGETAGGDPDDYRAGLFLYRYLGDMFHDGSGVVSLIPGAGAG